MGIESYSIITTVDKNALTVNFIIFGKIMEPKDYQPILDKIQALCKEFNSVSQHQSE